MHGTSSRDDRQKREQQRQEREMAKFAQMYLFLHPSYASPFFCLCGGDLYVILEPNCLSLFFGQLGRMLVSNSSCNSNRKILGLLQFPLKWKLLLHSQIRSRGRCWSLVFLLKVVPPRCAQSLSLSLSSLISNLILGPWICNAVSFSFGVLDAMDFPCNCTYIIFMHEVKRTTVIRCQII